MNRSILKVPTLLILVSVMLFFAAPAFAAVFHVKAGGTKTSGPSDPGVWDVPSNCYATIQAACDNMTQAGDQVRIYTGTYNNSFKVTRGTHPSGNADNYCVIRSDDGSGNYSTVTIQGSVSTESGTVTAAIGEDPWGPIGESAPNYWRVEYI